MIRLRYSTMLMLTIIVGLLIAYVSLEFAYPDFLKKPTLLDFNAFYLVSEMSLEGNLALAYDQDAFLARQVDLPGFSGVTLLWSYPPPFNIVIMPLAVVPPWAAYGVFITLTGVMFLYILRRLSGEAFHTVLVLFLPLILIIIRSGQNSFLIGSLLGLACILGLRKRSLAGLPLGLLVIKPHLAVGYGIWVFLDRRWSTALVSILTLISVSVFAAALFGPEVWTAALDSISRTGSSLTQGGFDMFRMTSIYAFLTSIGTGSSAAMAIHAISVMIALCALLLLGWAGISARSFMGAGVFFSAIVSPYSYDYDLVILAVAACLMIGDIILRSTSLEKAFLLAGSWVVSGYGLLMSLIFKSADLADKGNQISIAGPILLMMGALIARILLRDSLEVISGSAK